MRNRSFVLAQALEPRRLMSSASLNIDGVLTINGDNAANDVISVSIDPNARTTVVVVKINSDQPRTFNRDSITTININGLSGNDTITMDEKEGTIPTKVLVRGGDGNDTIGGGSESDYLYGDRGDDLINTGEGKGFAHGGDGNDNITGGSNRDIIWGDAGNDTINTLNGKNVVHAGDGNDTVQGGAHFDIIDGGAGHDSILGGKGDDILMGREGNDTVRGNDGNDNIWGYIGADNLSGDNGDDVIWGGANTDVINVGRGTKNAAHDGEDPSITGVLQTIDAITK